MNDLSQNIARIRELLPKITPAEWSTGGTYMPDTEHASMNVWSQREPGMQSGRVVAHDCKVPDAEFIFLCRNAIEPLLERVRHLEQENGALDKIVAALRDKVEEQSVRWAKDGSRIEELEAENAKLKEVTSAEWARGEPVRNNGRRVPIDDVPELKTGGKQ